MESLVYEEEQNKDGLPVLALRARIQHALNAIHGLTLLREVPRDSASVAVLQLLHTLAMPQPDAATIASAYSLAFRELAALVNEGTTPDLTDAWQAVLAARLLADRNPWSEQVERVGSARVSPTLRAQAQRDLHALQQLFQLDSTMLLDGVKTLVTPALPALRDSWLPWHDLAARPAKTGQALHTRDVLSARMLACTDWSELIEPLEQHWTLHGTGSQAHYYALRWHALEQKLIGIAHPDAVQLLSLVGQQGQQGRLRQNITRFLAGLPAQDMLLYGPPGTGKSSTLKALVNAYVEQGLRLVEVQKEDIGDLLSVVEQLGKRAPHYLLCIDDLSFEDHETNYKALKVVLEGTAQARPANVLICATSNRLNLIRENFSERGQPSEDVNWRDTMDEKQALAHRFGLRVTFMSPDQRQYLNIVETLARLRGLELPTETLQQRALRWERQHPGRSGRTARQFIDDLEAESKVSNL
ncbi:MAG TPA: ATP-binding protein [Ktedonobacteraceae bacterium]